MGPVISIRDPDDQRVDDYRNLTDAQLRQRQEPAAGLFMVEGLALLRQLLRSAYPVRSLLLAEAKLEELRGDLEGGDLEGGDLEGGDLEGGGEGGHREGAGRSERRDWPTYVASNEVMRAITGFHFHRGALGAAGRLPPADWRRIVAGQSVIAVAEDLSDHENMGALFRNAAAFGVGAILLSPRSVDPLYRRAIRVSMGQVLRVPWARISPWPDAVADLKAAGFRVVALTPDPVAPALTALVTAWRIAAVAVMVGAEGTGLSQPARAHADDLARIPMQPDVDSLNVATAAAIAFHELMVHAQP